MPEILGRGDDQARLVVLVERAAPGEVLAHALELDAGGPRKALAYRWLIRNLPAQDDSSSASV